MPLIAAGEVGVSRVKYDHSCNIGLKGERMTFEKRLKYFEEKYSLIYSGHLGKGKKEYIGIKNDTCRFCAKSTPEVTFKTQAHAVPEFLGNHQLILNNECDTCNTFFSNKLENNLDKYTKPYRIIAQIKGKKKIPNYKTKDKKSRVDFDTGELPAISFQQGSKFVSLNADKNDIKTTFHLEPYLPCAVYKCLIKIAMSVISEDELKDFKGVTKWILEEDQKIGWPFSPLILLRTFIPGPRPNKKTAIMVLKLVEKEIGLPYCYLVLCFGNIAYQIYIPTDSEIKECQNTTVNKQVTRFPLPFEENWAYGNLQYDEDNLSSCESVKDGELPINYHTDKITEIDPKLAESYLKKK